MKKGWFIGLCLISSSYAWAVDSNAPPKATPEPPDIPPKVESGEVLEPEVTIVESKSDTHEEYRINGRLYMVKVIPHVGPAYYLLDSDGDGTLDVRRDSPTDIAVPQWVIMSW